MKHNITTYTFFFFILLLYSCGKDSRVNPKEPVIINPISFLGTFEPHENTLIANVEESIDINFPLIIMGVTEIIGKTSISVSILRINNTSITCHYTLTKSGTYSANEICVNQFGLTQYHERPVKISISPTDRIKITNVLSITQMSFTKY